VQWSGVAAPGGQNRAARAGQDGDRPQEVSDRDGHRERHGPQRRAGDRGAQVDGDGAATLVDVSPCASVETDQDQPAEQEHAANGREVLPRAPVAAAAQPAIAAVPTS
jgi:hypothetical protein